MTLKRLVIPNEVRDLCQTEPLPLGEDTDQNHIHIYRGAQFVGRFDIENQIAMDGDQVLRYLEELRYKKSSKG